MVEGGILSGREIRKWVGRGRITIDPWDPTHLVPEDKLNPASYDLTLGPEVAVYKAVTHYHPTMIHSIVPGMEDGSNLFPNDGSDIHFGNAVLRVDRKNEVRKFRMPESGWLLKPGIGYLAHTAERVHVADLVPIVDGKSSIGRLFIKVHETAGYGDPGFDGQYTLEITCVHPVVIIPGMRICQMRFHTLVGEVDGYQGKGSYKKGELSTGPVESRSWKMFPPKEESP